MPTSLCTLYNNLCCIQSACDVDAKNNKNRTALHLAAYECNPRIVEKLVGYGAVLNVKDVYGDTPLHDVLAKMTPLTIRHADDTPQLNKVLNWLCLYHT